MQINQSYDYKGLTLVKISESLDELGPHSSIEIPAEHPFANETGMFSVAGQEGVFFISQGCLRVGTRSELKDNQEVYRLMHKEAHDRKMAYLNSLRDHDGFGPILKLAGYDVRKVSDEVPYIGYLRVHPITDELYQVHEWLYDPNLINKKVNGVYRILASNHIFFVQLDEICVHGEEEDHPLMAALQEKFPVPKDFYDRDEGPCGGAFASMEDYWRYRDSSLFRF